MTTPDYLAIGHITNDLLADGSYRPGGTVTFAALAARQLGANAGIVTAAPAQLRQLPLFEGIKIAGPLGETATIFENIYEPGGRRQFVRAVAPRLRPDDVPQEWQTAPVVHLGPVAQEIGPDLLDLFGPQTLVGLTPQGLMREWDSASGPVRPIEWDSAAQMLPRLTALILSIEDLPPGPRGQELLQEYAAQCPLLVCTLSAQGCLVYQNGQPSTVPAYHAQEIDPTGAGDVFAAAFLLQLRATGDPLAAARFANAAAALSIEHPGATGLPTRAQVEERMKQPPQRR